MIRLTVQNANHNNVSTCTNIEQKIDIQGDSHNFQIPIPCGENIPAIASNERCILKIRKHSKSAIYCQQCFIGFNIRHPYTDEIVPEFSSKEILKPGDPVIKNITTKRMFFVFLN